MKDSGIGISKQDQQLLFTPFSQVDSSDTRPYGGTGLGLYICKSLVELMGGAIGVESEKGKGSLFWFVVPFQLLTVANGDTVSAVAAPPEFNTITPEQ